MGVASEASVAPVRQLRRDALENQERVLVAAITAMAREGRNVPMATIAGEAGVGVATLYRRYPNRDALLEALTLRSFQLLLDLAHSLEAREASVLQRLGWWWYSHLDNRDQLVLPLGGGPMPRGPEVSKVRLALHALLDEWVVTGRREGSIRDDVTTLDLIIFGAMLVTPLPGGLDWDHVATRQLELHLHGVAAPGHAYETPPRRRRPAATMSEVVMRPKRTQRHHQG